MLIRARNVLVKVNLLSNDCASWHMLSRARNELVKVNLLSNDCASWHMLSRARNLACEGQPVE